MCPKNKKVCRQNGKCNGKEEDTEFVELQNEGAGRVSLQDGATWYHVLDKREIFEILDMCGDSDYMFVGGNTGHGKSGLSPCFLRSFSRLRANYWSDLVGFLMSMEILFIFK